MSEREPHTSRVFISYSHESKHHIDRVMGLARAFTSGGLDFVLGRYETGADEGWPVWMETNHDEGTSFCSFSRP